MSSQKMMIKLKITLKLIIKAIFILILNGTYLSAQITYHSEDYIQQNEEILFSESSNLLSNLNFDSTGSNITWDYSVLNYETQSNISYFDPENSGYKNLWCLANGFAFNCNSNFQNLTNIAVNELNYLSIGEFSFENIISHQYISDNSLENRMIGLTANFQGAPIPFTFELEDKDSIYQFPIEYDFSDSSTSRLAMNLYPIPINQIANSKRINIVDGWGALITPYGTFENVLKMKTVIEHIDTLYIDSTVIPTSYTEIEYKWWDKSYGLPVLTASGNKVGSITTITNIRYIDSTRCVKPNALFSYQPFFPEIDSLTQTATVNFNNLSSSADSLLWDFGDNTTSTSLNPSHTYNSSGTFNVQLVVFNTCENQLYTDTLSIPVFITDFNTVFLKESKIKTEINLYPNPAEDFIYIDYDSNLNSEVFDIFGNLILISSEKILNISSLKKGVYFINFTSKNGAFMTNRFIKK